MVMFTRKVLTEQRNPVLTEEDGIRFTIRCIQFQSYDRIHDDGMYTMLEFFNILVLTTWKSEVD